MKSKQIQENLLTWYNLNHRKLPFRDTNDPYRIWVSEVMLQQTQVSTVIPYYNRFMEQFPSVFDLAAASEDDVYKLWAGLGYYSRARNLLKCAREIVEVHSGEFPTDYKEALKLPGIGPYTAGAVLSIAYNLKHPAVDGNVMRVISRIYKIKDDIAVAKTRKVFEEKVQSILPQDVRHFNQAIMELGALICIPRNPKCRHCPLMGQCEAKQLGLQDQLPVKTKKTKSKPSYVGVAILESHGKILLIKKDKGLLAGLWGLPALEANSKAQAKHNLLEHVVKDYKLIIKKHTKLGEETHIFTHKTWKMIIYKIDVSLQEASVVNEEETIYDQENGQEILWIEKEDIKNYAISTAFQKALDVL